MKGLKSKHSFINSPNQFSSDLYFVSFFMLALSTGFIFVYTGLRQGRWPRVRVSNVPFLSRHFFISNLWTFISFYFFWLPLFVFILLLLYICQWKCFLLKTENRKFTTQNRILGPSTMLSIKAWVIIDNCIWPFYGRETLEDWYMWLQLHVTTRRANSKAYSTSVFY